MSYILQKFNVYVFKLNLATKIAIILLEGILKKNSYMDPRERGREILSTQFMDAPKETHGKIVFSEILCYNIGNCRGNNHYRLDVQYRPSKSSLHNLQGVKNPKSHLGFCTLYNYYFLLEVWQKHGCVFLLGPTPIMPIVNNSLLR